MLWPARRDDIGYIPDVFVVQPGDDSLQPGPHLLAQLGCLAGSRVPWPRQVRQVSKSQELILCTVAYEIKFSICQLHQPSRHRERLNERPRLGIRLNRGGSQAGLLLGSDSALSGFGEGGGSPCLSRGHRK